VLAGRGARAVGALARALSLRFRVFGLEDPARLDGGLAGMAAVLHCAGPFSTTSAPMVQACLRTGCHYLDITGELSVFEALHARDAEARAAGLVVLPGAGFDVVPSDALAATLGAALPGASSLELAFLALGGLSRGTLRTLAQNLATPGAECRGGRLVRLGAGWDARSGARSRTRAVDFGRGPVTCVSLPWGDVLTAHLSTGIPDVVTFGAVSRPVRLALALAGPLGPVYRSRLLQRALLRRIARGPRGPTAAQRARGSALVWGRASDAAGRSVEGLLQTPEAYDFTAIAAVALARHVLGGGVAPGFQTPSRACGAAALLALPGVRGLRGVVAATMSAP
jgi:short subunit dehydrogenase-like uncharacterized protein